MLASLLFLGGWLSPFQGWTDSWLGAPSMAWLFIKAIFFAFCFLWFRATFPRYRYDQIMRLGWKVFIPITIVWILVVARSEEHTSELQSLMRLSYAVFFLQKKIQI